MEIIMLTDYRKFLRQHIKQYKSMDKELISKVLREHGFNIKEYTFEEVINSDIEINDQFIIYTSSQNLIYKNYLDDILFSLSKSNHLVPNYDIFKAHENKGYQEILKKEKGINSLNFKYFGNLKALIDYKERIKEFPLVLKKLYGAGSTNVFKVDSFDDLVSKVKLLNKPSSYKRNTFKKIIYKFILKKKYIPELYEEDIYNGPFLLQDFMDGLNEDWKVLVFGSKYYVLNRKIRENDFRASGSGKLSFVPPPKEVLDYAEYIFSKLDLPFVSLDIGFDGKNCNLIEFQGTHFGPYTLVNSEYYYVRSKEQWEKISKRSVLEEEYAESIADYIKCKLHN